MEECAGHQWSKRPKTLADQECADELAMTSTDVISGLVADQRDIIQYTSRQESPNLRHSQRGTVALSPGAGVPTDAKVDESRKRPISGPTAVTLPSFSILNSKMDVDSDTPHAHRTPVHNSGLAILQNLRHQLRARDDALLSLREEHEKLQIVLSRTQARSEALEIKIQIADQEMMTLKEEISRLSRHNGELLAQVSKLSKQKQEFQEQVVADGAQWRQIMSMSSKLQLRSAEEARRFNVEREQWARERDILEAKVNAMTRFAVQDRDLQEPFEQSSASEFSMSEEHLRTEASRLQEQCRQQKEILTQLVAGSATMEQMTNLLRQAKERMSVWIDDTSRTP